ncbi:CHASE domain-containing protein [Crocosphaera sp. UHCC 0190]|uniref:CHASE domain-containing protein n=1 Tax=Crocosphaera sp. UHCC 0190 TaxID=3110246 RepID=UPI002B20122C|nr:CHASE domain-containing protein [Crocosphaera sp. UHCC 0190]MEA5510624.1 CHASE domain-containing protein [Crocosphaera sp. UHCC 0190]
MTDPSSRFHSYLPLGISLLIGGGISVIAAWTGWNLELNQAKKVFEGQGDHLAQHIQQHLQEYIQVTNALGIFYEASDEVTGEDFRAFTTPFLEEYSGILGMAWAPRISQKERPLYEKKMKFEGFPDFTIWEKDGKNPENNSEYFPVTYGEPKAIYQSVIGLNLGSTESLNIPLQKARNTGKITASEPINLINGGIGFILYYPIYRRGSTVNTDSQRHQEFRGTAYTVYRLEDLIKMTLKHLPNYELSFYLIEQEPTKNNDIFLTFDAQSKQFKKSKNITLNLPSSCQQLLNCQRTLKVADRKWSLIITPNIKLFPIVVKSGIILMFGLGLTALVTAYIGKTLVEKKRIEELVEARTAELIKTTEELEERVKQRTAQLEAANQGKNELLGQMSHELRTPLNIILGFLELLNRDRTLTLEQQENLTIMRRSGEYLLTLFNDILEISKLEVGSDFVNPTSFNLKKLIEPIIEMLKLKAQSKNLQLILDIDLEVPTYIKTDENKLRQILINLLDNAIKFTDKGSITLRLVSNNQSWTLDEISNNNDSSQQIIWIEVEDTGCGIPLDIQQKVFEPFFRGIPTEGAGLGLSITQKLVHLMGGKIYLNSQVNQGTIIQFYLPIILPEEPEVSQIGANRKIIRLTPNQQEYRILIVDDHLENRQLLMKFLQPIGFQLQEANNGQEALEIWYNWRPNLIFMDTRMPIMDGYRAIQQIKDLTQQNKTTIIAISSGTLENDHINRLASVCDDILYKPFEIERLLHKIKLHLGVNYDYENEEREIKNEENLSIHLTPSSLEMMPLDWINQVSWAASAGDSQSLYKLIQQIPHQQIAVAIGMTELVNHFNFRQIRELTQPLMNES